jgi:hypothetical protein
MFTSTIAKLRSILAILMLTFMVTACNDSKSDTAVEKEPATGTQVKTPVDSTLVKDSIDPRGRPPGPGGTQSELN